MSIGSQKSETIFMARAAIASQAKIRIKFQGFMGYVGGVVVWVGLLWWLSLPGASRASGTYYLIEQNEVERPVERPTEAAEDGSYDPREECHKDESNFESTEGHDFSGLIFPEL